MAYKKLRAEIVKQNLRIGDLMKILPYNNRSAISRRIAGAARFTESDKSTIYGYLIAKGYKGEKEELFEYSQPSKCRRQLNRFAMIVRQRMDELNLSNKDVVDFIREKTDGKLSQNSVSQWRSGKIEMVSGKYIFALCECLDISLYYLLGNDYFQNARYGQDWKLYYIPKIDAPYDNIIRSNWRKEMGLDELMKGRMNTE